MGKKRLFGELELAILQILQKKSPLSVREVLSLLKNEDKYTTVMTVMSRLVRKGELKREKIGKQYLYRVNEKQKKGTDTFFQKLKQRVFNGKSFSMICYFLESSEDITKEEWAKMEQLIQELKKKEGK